MPVLRYMLVILITIWSPGQILASSCEKVFEYAGKRLIEQHIDDYLYSVADPLNPKLAADTVLVDGLLVFNLSIKGSNGERSPLLRGAEQFRRGMEYFAGRFAGIHAIWRNGDNLLRFNQFTGAGMTPEMAAKMTWTGQQASSAGFKKVVFQELAGEPGKYTHAEVLFLAK
jgi:hypothetical protein